MNPKILLSLKSNKEYYIDAVEFCGGIADARYCPEASTNFDGLILCGGSDINPTYYGESNNGSINIDSERDKAELALLRAFIDAKKPVMGICRGYQLINVFLGGSLYQDIPNADVHINRTGYDCAHEVSALKGSICADLYGEAFSVNSAHHQAIKSLGENLIVTVKAGDTIEGYEHKSLPIFGVQWHPERMCCSRAREDTVDGIELFKYFIRKCSTITGRNEL